MPSKEAAELVPLSWAADIAYEVLVRPTSPQQASRSELLDLLALGISFDAPIYAVDEGGELRQLTSAELAGGRFAAGALRFEFHDGRSALQDLRVKIGDLPAALRTVVALKAGHTQRG
jgi:hypothetical protein